MFKIPLSEALSLSASIYLGILVLGELFYVKHVMLSTDYNKKKSDPIPSAENTTLIVI